MSAARARRPVGRPRGDGRPHLSRGEVFRVCAKLIAQHGFAGTGIRRMAEALDASPASLFHLFGSKDGLLSELIAFAAAPSLAFYEAMRALEAPAAVALYHSVREETLAVNSVDRDYVALFYLPELRKPQFAAAQETRAQMVGYYRELIERGMKDGSFAAPRADLAAEQIFQLTETSIISVTISLPAEEQAKATAELALRSLLRNPDALAGIADAAETLSPGILQPRL